MFYVIKGYIYIYPRLPTTITLIGFTESTKDFTLQTPGQPYFNGLGSLGYTVHIYYMSKMILTCKFQHLKALSPATRVTQIGCPSHTCRPPLVHPQSESADGMVRGPERELGRWQRPSWRSWRVGRGLGTQLDVGTHTHTQHPGFLSWTCKHL